MPYYGDSIVRKRSKLGRELDRKYARHEIGYTYYNKIRDKSIYWEPRK